ncbi:hypothetical protein OSB04_028219 [Centaurea solstitialis]|uniref:Uncharacterized protein n=1 Tax=Centaurea solstitialis TaxID=347529 RepID=A0AA38SMQ2_9ASTR|nr:hypothetical protein OSB04_028219 [Centaurea solstitialis]
MVSNEFRDEILLTGGDCDNPPILTPDLQASSRTFKSKHGGQRRKSSIKVKAKALNGKVKVKEGSFNVKVKGVLHVLKMFLRKKLKQVSSQISRHLLLRWRLFIGEMVSNEFRDEILLTGETVTTLQFSHQVSRIFNWLPSTEQSFVDKTLHFFEEPVEILDREIKKLKRSKIPIVKAWTRIHLGASGHHKEEVPSSL